MLVALIGWASLAYFVKWASSGPEKVLPPAPVYKGHIPSIADPEWGDWVSKGKNMEIYFSNLDRK